MNLRHIGFWLIFAGILVGIVTGIMKSSYDAQTDMIIERNNGSCFVNETIDNENKVECLHDPVRLIPFIGGGLLALTLAAFGAYLIIISKNKKTSEDTQTTTQNLIKKPNLKDLNPDEVLLYNKVVEAEGTIFQAELAEKTGFTKVKVTRILDRLEGRGLIDRRRRGMTNVVILKG
jgi:hypothetical protein